MNRVLYFLVLTFALQGCGVKLPPVAPQRAPEPPKPKNLDCSPKDPNCDREDPNYKSHR
jgi:hypothetical protein